MDLLLMLLVVAGVSTLFVLVRSVRAQPPQLDWVLVAFFILGLIALDLSGGARSAWGGVAWIVGVVLPGAFNSLAALALQYSRYPLSVTLGRVALWLHPSPPARAQFARLRSIEAWARGDAAAATRALERFAALGHGEAELARLDLVRMRAAPAEALILAREIALRREVPVGIVFAAIRSLAEHGALREAIDLFRKHRAAFALPIAYALRTQALLLFWSEAGMSEAVRRLFRGRLLRSSATARALWVAIAERDAAALAQLAGSDDRLIARAARVRLERPPCEELSPAERAYLNETVRLVAVEDRFAFGHVERTTPWLTGTAAASLVAMFAVEVAAGGATNEDTLVRLGALSGSAIIHDGEVWRLGSFMLLHYGAVHLLFNTLGLIVLGPFVERFLGRAAFTLIYVVSGLLGGALFVVRVWQGLAGDALLVGASGAIMGLAGALAASLWWGARRERALSARRRFSVVIGVLGLQLVLDAILPAVSMLAHASGIFAGAAIAAAWLRAFGPTSPVVQPPQTVLSSGRESGESSSV